MKKLIAYPIAWLLYYLGDFIWKAFRSFLYSKFMVWSYKVQDWGKLTKPWI